MSLLLAVLFVGWVGATVFLRFYRIWLLFYLVGAVGCAYWLILLTRDLLGLEAFLAQSVALSVHAIAALFGVSTRMFNGAPGVLLVLVIAQEIGWTVLQIGVESSGLLEISVLLSLLLFYPGWTLAQRGRAMVLGIALTWGANVLRVLIIVFMLHSLGKEALLLAHTFVGKAVFFFMTIAIYWYLLTLPTVRGLSGRWAPEQVG